jgi:Zn-dependent M16 (insulinase) family peptidase
MADLNEQLQTLQRRVSDLEQEVQENRALNRRLAELVDVVAELLLPISQRDDERVAQVLQRYRESL